MKTVEKSVAGRGLGEGRTNRQGTGVFRAVKIYHMTL